MPKKKDSPEKPIGDELLELEKTSREVSLQEAYLRGQERAVEDATTEQLGYLETRKKILPSMVRNILTALREKKAVELEVSDTDPLDKLPSTQQQLMLSPFSYQRPGD